MNQRPRKAAETSRKAQALRAADTKEAGQQQQNEELQRLLEANRIVEEELRTQNEEMATAQQQLIGQQRRYADLFHFAPDAYLTTDMQGVIQEANQAAQTLLNVRLQKLIGTPLALSVSEEQRKAFRAQLLRLRQPGTRLEGEWLLKLRGGASLTCIRDSRLGR